MDLLSGGVVRGFGDGGVLDLEFDSPRQAFSFAAENFDLNIFETEDFKADIHEALDETDKWHKRDCALKAQVVMKMVLMMSALRSLSIASIVKETIQRYRWIFPGLSISAITPEAFCHAKDRLGPEPLRFLFKKQAAKIKPVSTFLGLRVWAIDGVRIDVQDTPENEERFGRQSNSAFPQLLATGLVDVSVRQTRALSVASCHSGEREISINLLDYMNEDELAVMDRGFPSFPMFKEFEKRGLYFLSRIPSHWTTNVVETLEDDSEIVEVTREIPKEDRKTSEKEYETKLLRQINYRICKQTLFKPVSALKKSSKLDKLWHQGAASIAPVTLSLMPAICAAGLTTFNQEETIRLLTNLMDPEKYPAIELARFYWFRWESEKLFDEIKTHLTSTAGGAQKLAFRGKNPERVTQELYAAWTVHNLVRSAMFEAGRIYGINPLDLSFVRSLQLMNTASHRLLACKTPKHRQFIAAQLLKDISEQKLRRRDYTRICPRACKRRTGKYRSKKKRPYTKRVDLEKGLYIVHSAPLKKLKKAG